MVKLYRHHLFLALLLSLIIGASTALASAFFSIQNLSLHPLSELKVAPAVDCATPLVVSSTADDENTCGTLRSAQAYLTANPANPDKQISFSLDLGSRIALSSGLTLPAGATLQGLCGANGPGIIPDGTGVTADGLTFSGGNSIFGIAVGGFTGRQIVSASSHTANNVQCVRSVTGPLELVTSNGTPQSTTVGTTFSQNLQLVVKRWYGEPLQGVNVTFTINGNGASGSFSGGGTTATVVTDSGGVAITPAVQANTQSGNFSVSATVSGYGNQAIYYLTNLPGPPASIIPLTGSNQTAVVGTAFGVNMSTAVKDGYGNPVSGVAVTFSAPTTGATGAFPGGSNSTVTTDQNGVATVSSFTANHTAGSYTVSASVSGVNPSVTFSLSNQAGPPASLIAYAGSNQQTSVGTAFSSQLKTRVRDIYGNNISGVSVLFSTPPSGPGGTFSGAGQSAYAITDSNGIATAPSFTANTLVGGYTVSASVSGVAASASFSLSNLPEAPASITALGGSGQSANVGTSFSSPLKAVVKDSYGNGVNGVSITFSAPGSGASATFSGAGTSVGVVTDASGVATSPTLTANATAGPYTVSATVAGVGGSAGFSLTNTSNITTYQAWVSDPHPAKYTNVTVYGKLIVNGLPADGTAMDTTWHYRTTTSYCRGTVGSDGIGSCTKNTGNVTIGYTVVIDVVFTYNGKTYYTSTSFTP